MKLKTLSMIPIFIQDKKQVKLYYEYNKDEALQYVNQMNEWNKQNGLNSNIENDKINIVF
ncbi:hypothetical protein D3C73_1291070 [compost metagenome]